MKIIVFGAFAIEMRRQIEFFLDDMHEIIGYSDAYMTEDDLDGKLFIPLEDLEKYEYDYIVSAFMFERDSIVSLLEQYGVSKDNIIFPEVLQWNSSAKQQRDILTEIDLFQDTSAKAVIFGLSYSRRGLDQRLLDINCLNFSCPGLDMYYNNKLLQYTKDNRPELLEHIKNAFWFIPYYYFDYDMSQSIGQYSSGQICNMTRLKDWHNADKSTEVGKYISMFELFARRILLFYRDSAMAEVRKVWDKEGRGILQGSSWYHEYISTREENMRILKDNISYCRSRGWKPIIVVPPMYYQGMTEASKRVFDKKKDAFYEMIGGEEIEVWDYANVYKDKNEMFDSLDHLNKYGARIFAGVINERMKQN